MSRCCWRLRIRFARTFVAWADQRIELPFEWRLVHCEDLALFLRRHEDNLRAFDGLEHDGAAAGADESGDDLSLVRISEDDSPVVRIVDSTLYDALKVGASDIHLESRARELAIKYRVDGVLSSIRVVSGRRERGAGPFPASR